MVAGQANKKIPASGRHFRLSYCGADAIIHTVPWSREATHQAENAETLMDTVIYMLLWCKENTDGCRYATGINGEMR